MEDCVRRVEAAPDNIAAWDDLINKSKGARVVYENLLQRFPLCEQYWVNYAQTLTNADDAIEVYKLALQMLPRSLVVWDGYLEFCIANFPFQEKVLAAFEAARKSVGHHFYAHIIYDRYLGYLKDTGMTELYYALLRRIIEIPIYHYNKYFQEWIKLLQKADITTIKYFISAEELRSNYHYGWGDLLSHKEASIPDVEPEPFRFIRMVLKKRYTELYIAVQSTVWQIWRYEKQIKKPFYIPGRAAGEDTYESVWNSYIDYLETINVKTAYKGSGSTLTGALLDTLYERSLICTADSPRLWLKLCNSKLNRHDLEGARETLRRALHYCRSDRLLLRLVDLEMLSNNVGTAQDLLVSALEVEPNNLSLVLKLMQTWRKEDLLKLVELKLDDVRGTLFEEQFDYLFEDILSYDLPKAKLVKFFDKYSEKTSHWYKDAAKNVY